MKILFAGGGSLGPVTPLLAAAGVLHGKHKEAKFAWVGTANGPEKAILEKEKIEFDYFVLPTVKLPRYPSVHWLTFPFEWMRVKLLARTLLKKIRPDIVVSAGGFTAVPIVEAAHRMRIPCATHQLDLVPGLANRRIARKCRSVTTSFEYGRAPFGDRVNDEWIATPVRFSPDNLPSKTKALHFFHLDHEKPVVFITGGGTGARALNKFITATLDIWLKDNIQIVQTTGIGKEGTKQEKRDGYVAKPLFDPEEMLHAYAAADLVITRGGMGALSELASLKKAMIIVPIPNSHQEANAHAFEERGAAIVVHQDSPSFYDDLISDAKLLMHTPAERTQMGKRASVFLPTDDGTALAERIMNILTI